MSSDHRIATAKIRLSLRRNTTRTTITVHYDWSLLNIRNIRDKYALILINKFDALQEKSETHTPNDGYENFVNAYLEVVAECIPIKQRAKPRVPWETLAVRKSVQTWKLSPNTIGRNQPIPWNLSDKMKRSFFQAAVVSILLNGCTTWTLTKRVEKKLDANYTRMLRAILNKSWRQHHTKKQLYGHLPPVTKTIQVWRTRHAGHCWRSRDEFISDVLLWIPSDEQRQDDQPIQDIALKTYWKWWTIEKGGGERVRKIHGDDDNADKLYLRRKSFSGLKIVSLL